MTFTTGDVCETTNLDESDIYLDGSKCQRSPDDVHHDLLQLLYNQSFTALHSTHTDNKEIKL